MLLMLLLLLLLLLQLKLLLLLAKTSARSCTKAIIYAAVRHRRHP